MIALTRWLPVGPAAGIARFKPQDATTNPSLVYQAAMMPQYAALTADALAYAKGKSESVAAPCGISSTRTHRHT
jgi:transaldolase